MMLHIDRNCHFCHAQLRYKDSFICQKHCRAIYYCSPKCADDDWAKEHSLWCAHIAQLRASLELSSKLPNSDEFDEINFEKVLPHFLALRGLHCKGLWRFLTLPFSKSLHSLEIFASRNWLAAVCLEKESAILASPINCKPVSPQLVDWRGYYEWRGFSLDSPIAILFHWPLTIYHIVTQLLPKTEVADANDPSPFHIHIIGVEQEAYWLPVFLELEHLFPGIPIHLHFIGIRVPKRLHAICRISGNITVKFFRGFYHDYSSLEKPDIVIGFNAGLCAYASWKDTIEWIQILGVPTYFTDYNKFICDYMRQQLNGLCCLTEATLNPFRCPIRKFCDSHDISSYSNCFIYQLLSSH